MRDRGPGEEPIRAAGGVVWRPVFGSPAGSPPVEVVVVRRERYGDWSLPKGKLHDGERHKVAALREVREETGVSCVLGPKLATISYDTALGPKRVKWWAMTPLAGSRPTVPDDPGEIAEVEWLPFEQAWKRVTYGTDREVLRRFAERVPAP